MHMLHALPILETSISIRFICRVHIESSKHLSYALHPLPAASSRKNEAPAAIAAIGSDAIIHPTGTVQPGKKPVPGALVRADAPRVKDQSSSSSEPPTFWERLRQVSIHDV